MAWVRFTERFDWRVPGPRLVIRSYAAGTTQNVPGPCRRAAVAAGKAEAVRAPRRDEDPSQVEPLSDLKAPDGADPNGG